METTLNKIKEYQPYESDWKKLLQVLGKTKADDEALKLSTILKINGVDSALGYFKAVEGYEREKRLYAVWCAQQVKHLMCSESLNLLKVVKLYAEGTASNAELDIARDAVTEVVAATSGADINKFNEAYAAYAATTHPNHAIYAAATVRNGATDVAKAKDLQAEELKRLLDCIDNNVKYQIGE